MHLTRSTVVLQMVDAPVAENGTACFFGMQALDANRIPALEPQVNRADFFNPGICHNHPGANYEKPN
jgi:hypothetical protein